VDHIAASQEGVLDYFVLDVFSATRLAGNPLAVVLNPGTLSTETMQAMARETNLSETTFVERRAANVEAREGVRVRIFTTDEELPFAGHPTLGTASLLRAIAPECVKGDTVTLALNVGAVPVRFETQSEAWPVRGTMTQRDPEFGAILDAAEVAALTGLEVADFNAGLPIQIVSTGTAFAIVPLRSAAALARLRVRQDEATAFLRARGARWFYVLGPEDISADAKAAGPAQWRARMQFNGGEDPATGSAAGCAISHLVRHGGVAPDALIHVRQGVEMLRPSDLFRRAAVRVKANGEADRSQVTGVSVGGSTILVAKGQFFLP
jgi:trans-2,3-dihydro-3-hydroxyanthranilate isomerase